MIDTSINQLVPPEDMNFVGDGDFKKIGEEFLNYFVDLCQLKPIERVLDVGCGIGRMAIPLTGFLSTMGSYEGFDAVAEGISWCQREISLRFPNFRFRHADMYNLNYNPKGKWKASEWTFPYEDESFDFVFLTSVFTHLLPEDMENYLAEISRVLKTQGRCLITFFLLNQESDGLIESKQSVFDFRYALGKCHVVDLQMPEAAVSYDETYVLRLYKKCGLNIKLPIHYGNWCGRPRSLSGQDIIIAVKGTIDAQIVGLRQNLLEQDKSLDKLSENVDQIRISTDTIWTRVLAFDQFITEQNRSLDRIEQQLSKISIWSEAIESQSNSVRQILTGNNQQLSGLEKEVGRIAGTIEQLQASLLDANNRVSYHEREITQLNARVLANESELAWRSEQIQKAYSTRIWRLGQMYWRAHALLKSLMRF